MRSSVVSQSWLRIHFPKALVALQRNTLAAGRGYRIEQRNRPVDCGFLLLAPQDRRPGIDLLQSGRVLVELARISRAEQCLIECGNLGNAPNIALEAKPLALPELALPATLRLFRKRIKATSDVLGGAYSLARIIKNVGGQHARNRRLLDHPAIVPAVQPAQDIADAARLLDQRSQVSAGAVLPGKQPQDQSSRPVAMR